MSNVFVTPRAIDGAPAIVPDPQTKQPLNPRGEWKPRDAYWLRRLRDGDVIEIDPPPATKPAAAPPPAKKSPVAPPPAAAKF
jgi:hypothetical protein